MTEIYLIFKFAGCLSENYFFPARAVGDHCYREANFFFDE